MTSRSLISPAVRTPVLDFPTLADVEDEGAIDWMEANLVYGPGDLEGERYRLDEFQKEFLRDLYRVDPVTGRRVVQTAVLSVGKGGAKSELEAAIDLFELAGKCVIDDRGFRAFRRSIDIPVAAASYWQADLVFSAAMKMCEPFADLLDVYEKEISLKDGRGRIYKVAAAAGTNDGLRPTSVSIDELHEWTGNKERVYLILTNGLTKRRDAFEIIISTAGDPGSSHQLMAKYDYGKKVASGEVVDPSFLMHWYEADAELDISDHSQLVQGIGQANPASWIDAERVAKRFEVDRVPEHEFRRYFLNQWVSGGEAWLPAGEWDARADLSIVVADRERIVATFDGSYNGDSTVIVGATLDGDRPHLFEVGAWERPENATDWQVDRVEVDAAVDEMFRRFEVVEFACDPSRWGLYFDSWIERYGEDRVLEYPQERRRMVPATAKLYDAVTQGLVSHDGSPLLARHVGNATVKQIPGGRYMLQKDHPDRKIDGAVCAVMAYDRATFRRGEAVEVRAELW